MSNILKTAAGTALTIILTVFTLGIINGSGSKQYTVEDVPGLGWALRTSKAAGKAIGEKMRKPQNPPNVATQS